MKNLRLPLAEEPPRGPRSTPIEWTDATWNPVAGCKKVSPGCAHCYAERITYRLSQNPMTPQYHGLAKLDEHDRPRFTGKARFVPDRLEQPLHWGKDRMVFVNSMSDLFHEDVTFEQIAAVMGVIAASPQHTFQVLTKRAERMAEFFEWLESFGHPNILGCLHVELAERIDLDDDAAEELLEADWPLPNLWLGVSVEDRKHGLPRIEHLRRTDAALRFLSIEPLLEDLGELDLTGIGWVIVGGESGPGARPMHPDWVRSIRDQCVAAGVPFFFKQWGEWAPIGSRDAVRGDSWIAPNGHIIEWKAECIEDAGFEIYRARRHHVRRVGKKAAGHVLDGVEWRQMPRRP